MTNIAPILAPSGWLQLNVGGKELVTKLETLVSVQGSLLDEMAKQGHPDCMQDAAGVVHIDYDARIFEVILHFHRTGRLIRRGHSFEELLEEAKHWRLPRLEAFCNTVLARKQRIFGTLLPTDDTGQADKRPSVRDNGALLRHDANVIEADRQSSDSSAWDMLDDEVPPMIAQIGHDGTAASELPQVTSAQTPADESREAIMQHSISDNQPFKEKESAMAELDGHATGQQERAVDNGPKDSAAVRPPRVRVFRYPTIVHNKLPDVAVQSRAPDAQKSADESREAVVEQVSSDKQSSEKEEPVLTEFDAPLPGRQEAAVVDDQESSAATRPPRARVFRYPTIVNNKALDVTVPSHASDAKELRTENGDAKPERTWDTTPEDWDGIWNATQQKAVVVDQSADMTWKGDANHHESAATASVNRHMMTSALRDLFEVADSIIRGQSSGNLPATSDQSAEPPVNCPAVVNGEKRFAVLNQLNALRNGETKTSSSSVEPIAVSTHSGRATDAQHHRSSTSRGRYARGGGFGGTPRCMVVVRPAGHTPWGQPSRPEAPSLRTPYGSRATPRLRREEEW